MKDWKKIFERELGELNIDDKEVLRNTEEFRKISKEMSRLL